MTAPDAPRFCSECGFTPAGERDAGSALRYCRRHKIAVKVTAPPCAFAKPRTVPKPGQGSLL